MPFIAGALGVAAVPFCGAVGGFNCGAALVTALPPLTALPMAAFDCGESAPGLLGALGAGGASPGATSGIGSSSGATSGSGASSGTMAGGLGAGLMAALGATGAGGFKVGGLGAGGGMMGNAVGVERGGAVGLSVGVGRGVGVALGDGFGRGVAVGRGAIFGCGVGLGRAVGVGRGVGFGFRRGAGFEMVGVALIVGDAVGVTASGAGLGRSERDGSWGESGPSGCACAGAMLSNSTKIINSTQVARENGCKSKRESFAAARERESNNNAAALHLDHAERHA